MQVQEIEICKMQVTGVSYTFRYNFSSFLGEMLVTQTVICDVDYEDREFFV